MKKYIYAYKDVELEAFSVPRLDDVAPDTFAGNVVRGLKKLFKVEQLPQFIGQELWCLGTYNDETGEFTNDAHLLVKCDDYIAQRENVNVVPTEVKEGEN